MSNKQQEFVENLTSGKDDNPGAGMGIQMPKVLQFEMPQLPEEFENKLDFLERIASALERIAAALEECNKK